MKLFPQSTRLAVRALFCAVSFFPSSCAASICRLFSSFMTKLLPAQFSRLSAAGASQPHKHTRSPPPGLLYPPSYPPSVAAQQLSVTFPGPAAISKPASPLLAKTQPDKSSPPFVKKSMCERGIFSVSLQRSSLRRLTSRLTPFSIRLSCEWVRHSVHFTDDQSPR